jgi:endonuclease III
MYMANLSLFTDDRIVRLHEALLAAYGAPPVREPWPPLRQFVYSMLSSRTKTEVSHEVLYALERHFGSWEKVRDASYEEVLQIVTPATFPEAKARDLQKALRRITRQNHGQLNLDFLHGQPESRIRKWLESFDGVGPKTSAAVVNFSTIREPALVIDSHHQRIAERLHFVAEGTPVKATEDKLREMAPADWGAEMLDDHHRLVKLHGQQRCTKLDFERNCGRCPVLEMCPTGTAIVAARVRR